MPDGVAVFREGVGWIFLRWVDVETLGMIYENEKHREASKPC